MSDAINPQHYKHLPVEAIDIIDAAIEGAPSPQAAAAQSHLLGYALRANQKGQLATDAGKTEWYAARWLKAIREAEAKASGANEPPSEPTKRYREPTPADLANGPIECEVGDNHEKRTLIYVFPYGPARARFATVDKANPDCIGRWIDCRIEVQE